MSIPRENKAVEIADLYRLIAGHKSKYSIDDRIKAATHFIVEGNMSEVSRIMDIPYYTLKDWKELDWWQAATTYCRKQHDQKMDSYITATFGAAIKETADRIKNGDHVLAKMVP